MKQILIQDYNEKNKLVSNYGLSQYKSGNDEVLSGGPPATYYLNAGSLTQDGLTPNTGYHTFAALIAAISIIDGSAIELVDNGIIDDSGAPIHWDQSTVIFRSYSGNVNRPTWKLAPGEDALSFTQIAVQKEIQIHNIKFVGSGSYSGIQFKILDAAGYPSVIDSCHFNNVQIIFRDTSQDLTVYITNNIFTNLSTSDNVGCVEFHINTDITAYINNNDFYSGSYGIIAFGALNGKALNNIFLNQSVDCVYLNGSPAFGLIFDYSVTFGWGSQEFGYQAAYYVGAHNLRNTNPLLADPSHDDFVLQAESPCILSGIGVDIEPSVPVFDYDGVSRNSTTPYVGVYESFEQPSFSATPLTGNADLSVQFTDLTIGSVSWDWNFGDSTPHATIQNPLHIYTNPGVYTVSLTVNGTTTYTKPDYITVLQPIHGVFYANINNDYDGGGGCCSCCCCGGGGHAHRGSQSDPFNWRELNRHSETHTSGQTYHIKGTRTLDSVVNVTIYISHNIWEGWNPTINGPWRIGNIGTGNIVASSGSNSLIKNAIFFANQDILSFLTANDVLFIANQMVVTEIAVFQGCSFFLNTNLQLSSTASTVIDSLIGVILGSENSTFNNCSFISAVDLGTFHNCQSGWPQPPAPLWYGPKSGFYSSILAADTSSPPQPGNPPYTGYTVGLWDTTRTGIGAAVYSVIDFTASPTSGYAYLSVAFTDLSPDASSWNWNFGDGTHVFDQNPVHLYTTPSIYSITLTTNNGSFTKTNYVDVLAPNVDFSGSPISGYVPFDSTFSDLSAPLNRVLSRHWNFGDSTSLDTSQVSVLHTYLTAGAYSVNLTDTFTDWTGTVGRSRANYINVSSPYADFSGHPVFGTYPLSVDFVDLGQPSGRITSHYWDFGDGTNSSLANPNHVYLNSGTYTVSLTEDISGWGTVDRTGINYITVVTPRIYYLNAGSFYQDGVSPGTGFHSIYMLTNSVTLYDGDIIELVDNGVIEEPYYISNVSAGITIRSYRGNKFKPQWKIGFIDFNSGSSVVSIYDIQFVGPTADNEPSHIRFESVSAISPSVISRCHFNNVNLYFALGHPMFLYITNNTFTNLNIDSFFKPPYITLYSSGTFYINNNTFADGGYYAICMVYNYQGGIYNNIFVGQVDSATFLSFGISPPIDYNICYQTPICGGGSCPYVGSNNILSTDPMLVDSSNGNYHLAIGSPCINNGIGHSSEASIPLDDYDLSLRSVTNDIGAYIAGGFTMNPSSGFASLSVSFTDLSFGSSSWDWNFGDGSPHDASQNPTHIYSTPGIYTVTLVVDDTITYVKQNSVNVLQPFAYFISDTTSGILPLTVNFFDACEPSDRITNWAWDFGDTTQSSTQNPTHIYNDPGSYSVTLTATISDASSVQLTRVNYINVSLPFAANPVILPASGFYGDTVVVSITCSTPSSVIHYTLDGSTPTLLSPVYTAPFSIFVSTTIKAVAYATGYNPSAIVTNLYVLRVFYVDISDLYPGTGHSGTPSDPFSFTDMIADSSSRIGPEIYRYITQGTKTLNSASDVHLYLNNNALTGWNSNVNGPWRIGNTGVGRILINDDSAGYRPSKLEDGIIYSTSEIRNVGRCQDTILIAPSVRVNNITSRGSSIYGNSYTT